LPWNIALLLEPHAGAHARQIENNDSPQGPGLCVVIHEYLGVLV